MTSPLSQDEKLYYGRQMIVPDWGEEGQEKLKNAKVLVIGAGGLGAPLLMYLATAGVGRVGIVDGDFVETSNLHRQVIHGVKDLDRPKVESAAETMRASNPHIEVVEHFLSVTPNNVEDVLEGYDIVADCTDNFATRSTVAEACEAMRVPLVSGAAQIMDGTVTTFTPYLGEGHPCFRCLYPVALGPEFTPSCAQIGVAGPVLAVVGGLQAMEVLKEIMGLGQGLSGRMLIYNGTTARIDEVRLQKRKTCDCSRSQSAAKRA